MTGTYGQREAFGHMVWRGTVWIVFEKFLEHLDVARDLFAIPDFASDFVDVLRNELVSPAQLAVNWKFSPAEEGDLLDCYHKICFSTYV
jgi:hypothetical protein